MIDQASSAQLFSSEDDSNFYKKMLNKREDYEESRSRVRWNDKQLHTVNYFDSDITQAPTIKEFK